MKVQRVTFKTAMLAKEKGFDRHSNKRYFLDKDNNQVTDEFVINKVGGYEAFKNLKMGIDVVQSLFAESFISKPTQSLVQKWLREKHNIKVSVDSSTNNGKGEWVDWYVSVNQRSIIDHRDGLDTYEEALEVGLLEALKLI